MPEINVQKDVDLNMDKAMTAPMTPALNCFKLSTKGQHVQGTDSLQMQCKLLCPS
jgi:hypothetical protein